MEVNNEKQQQNTQVEKFSIQQQPDSPTKKSGIKAPQSLPPLKVSNNNTKHSKNSLNNSRNQERKQSLLQKKLDQENMSQASHPINDSNDQLDNIDLSSQDQQNQQKKQQNNGNNQQNLQTKTVTELINSQQKLTENDEQFASPKKSQDINLSSHNLNENENLLLKSQHSNTSVPKVITMEDINNNNSNQKQNQNTNINASATPQNKQQNQNDNGSSPQSNQENLPIVKLSVKEISNMEAQHKKQIENIQNQSKLLEKNGQNNVKSQDKSENKTWNMSKNSYLKVKDKQHAINSYDEILADDNLKNSVVQRFEAQRQPKWFFTNESLETQNIQQLKVLVLTWNMQGGLPVVNVNDFLNVKTNKHHIVAIGCQECQRSILTSLICSSKQKWETILQNALMPDYQIVESITLNAQYLVVFVHNSLKSQISQVQKYTEATGICKIVGNKGGVAIKFNLGKQSYLFINSHLASGQNRTQKRNRDTQMIATTLTGKQIKEVDSQQNAIKKKQNTNKIQPLIQDNKNENSQSFSQSNKPKQRGKLNDYYDNIFWMGDLNYRIQLEKESAYDMIVQKDFMHLLMIDQLLLEKEKGNTMIGFQEGLILFPPTYKMQVDCNQYQVQGKKARIPGWTDRILFSNRLNKNIQLVNYECGLQIYGSDHRPVFAQFLLKYQPLEDDGRENLVQAKSSACQIF